MAAPTIAIIAYEPTVIMSPSLVGYQVDPATVASGDGSSIDDCMVYWYVTARNASNTDTVPDRYRKLVDKRMISASGMVTIAGSAVSTIVDLLGASSGRNRNLVFGWSQEYILTEGEWTINALMVNPSGETTLVTHDVTVVAEAYTVQTLGVSGRDHSDWDAGIAWLTGADTRKLIVDNDFSGTHTSFAQFDRNNCYMTIVDPEGDVLPVMMHDATTGNTNRLIEFKQGFEGSIVECATLIGSTRSANNNATGLNFRGNYCAGVRIEQPRNPQDGNDDYFRRPIKFDSISQAIQCNLVMNCTAAGSGIGSGSYTVVYAGGNRQDMSHVYGGVFGASNNESILRTTVGNVVSAAKIMYGFYDNSLVASKSCIRSTGTIWSNIINVRCLDGEIWMGLVAGSGVLDENHNSIDGCLVTGASSGGANIDIKYSMSHVRIRNCNVGINGISMGTGGQASDADNNDDIRVYGCTSAGKIGSMGIAGAGSVSGAEIKGNIVMAGGLKIATAPFAAGAIDNNRVSGQMTADGSDSTIEQWNALSVVGTDIEGDTVIGDFGIPVTNVETMNRMPENPNDMWGFARDAVTRVGCTNAINAVASPSMVVSSGGDLVDGQTLNVGASIAVDESTSVTLTITNDGDSALVLGTIAATGLASVDAGNNPSNQSVPPGLSSTVTIDVDTATPGAIVGGVSIPSNDSGSPFDLVISGTIIAPSLTVSDGGGVVADAGTIALGGSALLDSQLSVSLTIENTGTADAAIGQLSASGHASINAGSNPSNSTLAPGASVPVVLTMDTSSLGAMAGSLVIPSDDLESPYNLSFTGTVVSPAITLLDGSGSLADGNTLGLGNDIVQDSVVSVSLTIENTGTADAAIGTITTTGLATIDAGSNPSNSTLAPGATVPVVMSMDTSASGTINGSVSVASDDPASPFVITFLGTVLAADTPPDPNSGPETRQEYLSVAECDGIVDQYLIGATTLKRAWASLTPADKLICIAQASIDFDSIPWIGSVVSKTQPTLWPRVDSDGDLILPGGEPIVPESVGETAWTFAGLPREIRIGVAIQAASRAASQLRLDTDSEYIGRARRGITTNAGGGLSVSVDQSVASRPSSQLHHVVYDVVAAYLPRSVGAI